jgi:protoporphyrin/coproporphyrin ferrochelatase
MSDKRRIAIVLFNLGGPDGPQAVQPFLKNLFSDPAIIGAPGPIRWALANLISRTRAKSARANYAKMGGGSPLVPETLAQARALEDALMKVPDYQECEVKVFLAMRYWHPFIEEAVGEVARFAPDETVLLPLYPQFSTTTTDSSLKAWRKAGGQDARLVCCYPGATGFLAGHVERVLEAYQAGGSPERVRILWSAHGLPEKIILAGDPYQKQVEETVGALKPLLPDHFEHMICYQSRVGPLKWIGPSTEAALEKAASDGIGVIVVPIAFVSEHIETLVELDEEYQEKAHELGVPFYLRAKALGTNPSFIAELANLVDTVLRGADPILAARTVGCVVQCRACPRGYVGGCQA